MGVEGCRKCIKYLLFFINFIFWLVGLVILAISLWLLYDGKTSSLLVLKYEDSEAPNAFYISVYILMAVGAVMLFVGFLGCYGALRESRYLLGAFFTCLVILFVCEVAAGIYVVVHKDKISKEVISFYDTVYDRGVQESIAEKKASAAAVLKVFHESLLCCGKGDLTSAITVWATELCPKTQGSTIIEDCHTKIKDLFSGKLYLIGIAVLVVAFIMVFEMIFSMVLCRGGRNRPLY
ncbi:CD81 antigen [Bagarius yarrelli]|uniref:Tetraspanin n=1 Tax=Bagarius yarrelli TaxID=175774 RepID=A0A556TTU7_BAGYA|nr:CD81 antigen [Bagarius yarrelli]